MSAAAAPVPSCSGQGGTLSDTAALEAYLATVLPSDKRIRHQRVYVCAECLACVPDMCNALLRGREPGAAPKCPNLTCPGRNPCMVKAIVNLSRGLCNYARPVSYHPDRSLWAAECKRCQLNWMPGPFALSDPDMEPLIGCPICKTPCTPYKAETLNTPWRHQVPN